MRGVRVSVRNASKRYGPTVALRGISFDMAHGEAAAIIGHNGSGKTTLLRAIARQTEIDTGSIERFSGDSMDPDTSTFLVTQEPSFAPDLTGAENAWLRLELTVSWKERPDVASVAARVSTELRNLGHAVPLDVPVTRLSLSQQQVLSLAIALASEPQLLLLDEPAATLTGYETTIARSVLARAKSAGATALVATHRGDVVDRLVDRVLVLEDGFLVGDFRGEEAKSQLQRLALPRVDRACVGDAETQVLSARWTASHSVRATELVLHAGEVLALVGAPLIELSGLLRTIGGLDASASCQVTLHDRPFMPVTPQEARAAGVAYVTSDRTREGIFPAMTVRENLALGLPISAATGAVFLDRRAVDHAVNELATKFAVPMDRLDSPAGALSGGNQQKVILARAVASKPVVLLVDNATRGLDSRARAECTHAIRAFAQAGGACLLTAAEDDFVTGVSDRVVRVAM